MHFSLQRCVNAELSLRCILHLTAKGSCQSSRLQRKVLKRVSNVPNKCRINTTGSTIIVHIKVCSAV